MESEQGGAEHFPGLCQACARTGFLLGKPPGEDGGYTGIPGTGDPG